MPTEADTARHSGRHSAPRLPWVYSLTIGSRYTRYWGNIRHNRHAPPRRRR